MLYNTHILSLYCDNAKAVRVSFQQDAKPGEHLAGEFPTLFYHASETVCRQRAKQAGWRFYRNGRTLCPRCVSGGIRL